MSKLAIRLSIICIAIYLILCYVIEIMFDVNIWSQTYYLLFEICTCLCISKQGVYHCRFIKYTAYGILISDTLVCANNIFDFLPINWTVYVPPTIISIGLATTTTLAIRHFERVRKINRKWEQKQERNHLS